MRRQKRKANRLIESLEPRQLLTDPISASGMFVPLNAKAGGFFTTANNAVADSVESTVNGIGTAFGNSLADARIQVQSVPAWLNMGPNGFDALTMADFADAFQDTNSEITAATQVTAPTSSLGGQFAPGTLYPSMDFAPFFSIYGNQGNAWFNSSTNTGGANGYITITETPTAEVAGGSLFAYASYNTGDQYGYGENFTLSGSKNKLFVNEDHENWTADVRIDQSGLNGNFSVDVKHGPLTVCGQLMWYNSQLTTSHISIDYVLPGQEFHATRYWSASPHEMRTASYRNTVNPNVTILSDYRFETGVGTQIAGGVGYWIDDHHYVESSIARNTPTTGPATSAAKFRGDYFPKTSGNHGCSMLA